MNEVNWRIAHDIASELAARQTDINVLAQASEYLTRARDVNRFFRWLDEMERAGELFAHSRQTPRYRREVRGACQRLLELATGADDMEQVASNMAHTLAWSVRLMAHYQSNRQLARERSPVKILTIRDLKEGMELEGVVREIRPFGAFIDLGLDRDGLVHISQLADWRVDSVEEVVSIGQRVRVKVLEVDQRRRRIGLSMKDLEQEEKQEITPPPDEGDEPEISIIEAAFKEALDGQKEQPHERPRKRIKRDRGAAKRAEHQRLLDEMMRRQRDE